MITFLGGSAFGFLLFFAYYIFHVAPMDKRLSDLAASNAYRRGRKDGFDERFGEFVDKS